MKTTIHTPLAPTPRGPYAQAAAASGVHLYIAAQGPIDPLSGQVVAGGFAAQARRAFENLLAILGAAGGSPADVVKVTVCLSDWQDFAEMNAIYREYFSEPYPARTPMLMPLPAGLIMVDAVAVLAAPQGGAV